MTYKKESTPKLTDKVCKCGCGQRLYDFETLYSDYKAAHYRNKMNEERQSELRGILNNFKKHR